MNKQTNTHTYIYMCVCVNSYIPCYFNKTSFSK